ncbi:hypothetical protein PC116_g25235 [Phytophthora cactorum]|nr:hypothetical protein Pcac1_g9375 [Phytophthora cactorum]KAG3156219.1 hypothetical protein PC128_g21914 [Phytophthora cactorum]KAG4226359.1 hypothetical protein PC116_g25235 [Phytophthora cactorum]
MVIWKLCGAKITPFDPDGGVRKFSVDHHKRSKTRQDMIEAINKMLSRTYAFALLASASLEKIGS